MNEGCEQKYGLKLLYATIMIIIDNNDKQYLILKKPQRLLYLSIVRNQIPYPMYNSRLDVIIVKRYTSPLHNVCMPHVVYYWEILKSLPCLSCFSIYTALCSYLVHKPVNMHTQHTVVSTTLVIRLNLFS